MNPISYISNKINRVKKDKYKILTFSTHEAYQEAMAKTGHHFYLLQTEGCKQWNEDFRKLPSNCTIINNIEHIPYDIDFLLSQERYSQLQKMSGLSNHIRLPLIHLDHVEPVKNQSFPALKALKADFNVFITEHNKESWENTDGVVISHGINSDTFSGWIPNTSKTVVYIVNYLKERDFFCGWKEWEYIKNKVNVIDPTIKFKLIGDNPGISKTISDPKELALELKKCACYINTSKFSPVPMSLLEAMSCGMPIVSTKHQQVAKLLNESNSISSNDLDQLADGIVNVCNNNKLYKSIGVNARNEILNKFSMESFMNNWNDIFDKAYNKRLGELNEIFYNK